MSARVAASAATQYSSDGIDVTSACSANRPISASNSAKSPTMSSSLSRRFVAMPSSTTSPCARQYSRVSRVIGSRSSSSTVAAAM